MGNPILEYFQKLGEELGMARSREETAIAMLFDRFDPRGIVKYTGIYGA